MISPKKRIWGWYFFDWASQPYNTLLLTFIFGPYFAEIARGYYMGAGLDEEAAKAAARVSNRDRRFRALTASGERRARFLADVEAGTASFDILRHKLLPYQREGMLHLAFGERALREGRAQHPHHANFLQHRGQQLPRRSGLCSVRQRGERYGVYRRVVQ